MKLKNLSKFCLQAALVFAASAQLNARTLPPANSETIVYEASESSKNGNLDNWYNESIICSSEYTYSEGGRLIVTMGEYNSSLQARLQALSLSSTAYANLYPTGDQYVTEGWIKDNEFSIDLTDEMASYMNRDDWKAVIKGRDGKVAQIMYVAPAEQKIWRVIESMQPADGDFKNWNNTIHLPAYFFDEVEAGDMVRIEFSSVGGGAQIQLAYNAVGTGTWTQFVDSDNFYSSPYDFTINDESMLAGFKNDGLFIKGQDATVSNVIIRTTRPESQEGGDIDVTEVIKDATLLWCGKDDVSKPVKQSRAAAAFDNDPATYTNFGGREGAQWVGLEYPAAVTVKQIRYMLPAGRVDGSSCLGVFQGANDPTFIDAIPLGMVIPEEDHLSGGEWYEINVNDNTPYKYVRYVGPGSTSDMNRTNCRIAELRFVTVEPTADAAGTNAIFRPTNLPLVIVNTQGDIYFDNNYENKSERNTLSNSRVTIVDRDGSVNVQQDKTEIRGRGNFSWSFPKKPFRIKFNKSTKVLGSECKAKKWTMINNYGDKTLIRNKIGFEMSKRLQLPYTPNCNLVDLIFNGQYMGTYQLCDQIDIRPGRVDIHEIDRDEPSTDIDETQGGFLVEIDAYACEEKDGEWFLTTCKDASGNLRDIPVTVKSPDAAAVDPLNDPIYLGLKGSFTAMMQSVFDSANPNIIPSETNWGNSGHIYEQHLDLASMMKYIILEEYMSNPDAFWSCYMYKDYDDPIWHVGPVWDFDIALGNYRWGPENFYGSFIPNYGSYAGNFPAGGDFNNPDNYQYAHGKNAVEDFLRIILDNDKNKQLRQNIWTWAVALQGLHADADSQPSRIAAEKSGKGTILSAAAEVEKPKSLNEFIDAQARDVEASARLNFMRWPILNVPVHDNLPEQSSNYMDHIDFVKNYITQKQSDLTKAYGWNQELLNQWVESGVDDIDLGTETDNDGGSIRYYNLQGVEVTDPCNGIFIRISNGKATKVAL